MAAFPNGTKINIEANKDGRPPTRDAPLPKADQGQAKGWSWPARAKGQPWPGQRLIMACQDQPWPAQAC